MKNSIIIIFAFSVISCTKIIDIDLNKTAPQIVIEGIITDIRGIYEVKITRTVNFSDPNAYPAVRDAEVTITDNLGNTEKLTEAKPGIYQTKNLRGVAGRRYSLKVIIDGKTYTATSTMPRLVRLEGIEIFESSFQDGSSQKLYDVIPQYQDPADVDNYYFFNQYYNGQKDKGFFNAKNDNFTNGLPNAEPIFYGSEFKLKSKDSLKVEMFGIDKSVYDYFFSMSQLTSEEAGTPVNPISNILGGALGYFSAQTVQSKTVVIP